MSLARYRKKRRFGKTPEPAGTRTRDNKRRIFVVQEHHTSHLHWDFRLEHRGVLKSWAVPKGPPRKTRERRLAIMVEDHPYAYKDFEGRIPPGEYGAGIVKIWDRGIFEPIGPLEKGLRNGRIRVILHGKKLKGGYALVRLRNQKNWLFIKTKKNL